RTRGGLLVGELSGRVLKVQGTSFTVLSNALFKHITGCTSDRHGNVYFVNMFGAGSPLTNPIDPDFFVGSIVKYNVGSGQATTLTASDHRLLAFWAAACAEHVLHLFESVQSSDPRPREAIEQIRAWARGEIRMSQSRAAGGHAMAAARELSGAARHAAYAAGQAAVVAHVAAHELGAAAYAIKAVRAAAPGREGESAGRLECRWQRDELPDVIRELV